MMRAAVALLLWVCAQSLYAQQPFYDRTYPSKVFSEPRHFRIFLPPAYESSTKRYGVIYYFHGHSDRYTLEAYDKGLDTVPKIVKFVTNHDAIVVASDGYRRARLHRLLRRHALRCSRGRRRLRFRRRRSSNWWRTSMQPTVR